MAQTVSDLIKAKLNKIDQRKGEQPNDQNHALQVLADYALYFQGAEELGEALGGAAEDMENIKAVRELIDNEANAIERRQALLGRLG